MSWETVAPCVRRTASGYRVRISSGGLVLQEAAPTLEDALAARRRLAAEMRRRRPEWIQSWDDPRPSTGKTLITKSVYRLPDGRHQVSVFPERVGLSGRTRVFATLAEAIEARDAMRAEFGKAPAPRWVPTRVDRNIVQTTPSSFKVILRVTMPDRVVKTFKSPRLRTVEQAREWRDRKVAELQENYPSHRSRKKP